MDGHVEWGARESREACFDRQGSACALCGERMSRDRFEAHHRLRRALMPAGALWCPCNIVALHPRCHTQGPDAVHDNPERARGLGLILASTADPRTVPVTITWPWQGPAILECVDAVVASCDWAPLC